jgi:transcriptional regulator with XRE-family HTH domain
MDETLLHQPTLSVGGHIRKWRTHRHLSQLQLANLADVSGRHLSFIESGRTRPSRDMILRLARCLHIPFRAVNETLQAGGFADAYPLKPQKSMDLVSAMEAVRLLLSAQDSCPAFVIDRHWNLVATNSLMWSLLEGVDPMLLQPPINILRLTLHPRGLAPHIVNLSEMTHYILKRLRRDIEYSGDTQLIALQQEICGYVSNAKEVPDEMYEAVVSLRLLTSYGILSMFGMITVFGTPHDVGLSELVIETFFPRDEEGKSILAKLQVSSFSNTEVLYFDS